MNKLRRDDEVIILAGKDRGKRGTISGMAGDRVTVNGVNMVKRHTKPNSENPKGGIVEKQLPINISNLSLMTKDGEKTRVGFKVEDGKKVRISKKSKEII